MARCFSRSVSLGIAPLAFAGLLAFALPVEGEEDQAENAAEQLVDQALAAAVAGEPDRRQELLQQAVAKDPDYPPARWHSGQVQRGKEWLPLDEAQSRAASDERLVQYRKLRDKAARTPAGELALARWCRKNQLENEGRVHWLAVLQAQPQNQEALRALDMRWDRGRLVTIDQIKQEKADRLSARSDPSLRKNWRQYWESRLNHWRTIDQEAAVRETIREELASHRAPWTIPVLDAVLQERSRSKAGREQYRQLSLRTIEALEATAKPWAVESIVRHAVYHPIPEVRTAAADVLRRQPKETYMPILLGHLRPVVESDIVPAPGSGIAYRASFRQEGAEADFEESLVVGVRHSLVYTHSTRVIDMSPGFSDAFVGEAAALQQRIDDTNAVSRMVNKRVQEALVRTTGDNPGESPQDWYDAWRDYWYDYYELEKPETKPLYRRSNSLVRVTITIGLTPTSKSCFPHGTKVWTITGPAPIQQIKPGDQVLAQDPRSGELTYKPVLTTTVRNPTPLVRVSLGSETITSTRGHPFWVVGEGWKMAKHLRPGMRLHTIDGGMTIDRVEELPPAKPWNESGDVYSYNLVVDELHNYFVGDARLLAHDNLLFTLDGALGPVPGLALAAEDE